MNGIQRLRRQERATSLTLQYERRDRIDRRTGTEVGRRNFDTDTNRCSILNVAQVKLDSRPVVCLDLLYFDFRENLA